MYLLRGSKTSMPRGRVEPGDRPLLNWRLCKMGLEPVAQVEISLGGGGAHWRCGNILQFFFDSLTPKKPIYTFRIWAIFTQNLGPGGRGAFLIFAIIFLAKGRGVPPLPTYTTALGRGATLVAPLRGRGGGVACLSTGFEILFPLQIEYIKMYFPKK